MSVALTSFIVFAASQIGTPGPANMALMATGARFGFRAAVPFVAGVALGKQLVIWPVGFGLMQLADRAPGVFVALKFASAAYIIWLAWKVANLRLGQGARTEAAPGFLAGLIVHPLNPKAWAMIVGSFTAFIAPGTPGWPRWPPCCWDARSCCTPCGRWPVRGSQRRSQAPFGRNI